MYPYHLGCHLKTGQLCRIPHPALGCGIPVGFARVLKVRLDRRYSWRYVPYNLEGELEPRYWSIKRWTDIQGELGEPRTGSNMLMMLYPGE